MKMVTQLQAYSYSLYPMRQVNSCDSGFVRLYLHSAAVTQVVIYYQLKKPKMFYEYNAYHVKHLLACKHLQISTQHKAGEADKSKFWPCDGAQRQIRWSTEETELIFRGS